MNANCGEKNFLPLVLILNLVGTFWSFFPAKCSRRWWIRGVVAELGADAPASFWIKIGQKNKKNDVNCIII